jgi:hypothetical protein
MAERDGSLTPELLYLFDETIAEDQYRCGRPMVHMTEMEHPGYSYPAIYEEPAILKSYGWNLVDGSTSGPEEYLGALLAGRQILRETEALNG